MSYDCDTCQCHVLVPNYVPYGSTTVLEGNDSHCSKGWDAELGDCPDGEYVSGEDCMLGGRIITKGWNRAAEAGVD